MFIAYPLKEPIGVLAAPTMTTSLKNRDGDVVEKARNEMTREKAMITFFLIF